MKSIWPTIKYQPKKANAVADSLSKNHKTGARDSMDDLVAATIAIDLQVMVLSGVNVELTTEDLQRWTITYKGGKN